MTRHQVRAALVAGLLQLAGSAAYATPNPTGFWIQNNSSVKIQINNWQPEIVDYRVRDITTGLGLGPVAKYAGRRPFWTGRPNTEIEFELADAQPHTLIVEAVDALGPIPAANVIDFSADQRLCAEASSACRPFLVTGAPMAPVGADEGWTLDGFYSINGQGSYGSAPHVLSSTLLASVSAQPAVAPIPSVPGVLQRFFDPFDPTEQQSFFVNVANSRYSTVVIDPASTQFPGPAWGRLGIGNYTVNSQNAWDILYSGADLDNGNGGSFTTPLFARGTFNDILLSGPTVGYQNSSGSYNFPARNESYASMAFSPKEVIDLSGGKLLHVTAEVDAEFFQGNRWAAIVLGPAFDPIASFRFDDIATSTPASGTPGAPNLALNTTTPALNPNAQGLNNSNRALWVQILHLGCDAALFNGANNPTGDDVVAASAPNFIAEDYTVDTGPNGALANTTCAPVNGAQGPACYFPGYFMQPPTPSQPDGFRAMGCSRLNSGNGRGLHDRSRFDLFVTQTGGGAKNAIGHLILFEDGVALAEADVATAKLTNLPFTQAKLYFVHYAYAMDDSTEGLNLPGQGIPGSGQLGYDAFWQASFPSCTSPGVPIANCTCPRGGYPCVNGDETLQSHGAPLATGSFPYSDERHWDNLGFEVLPASYVPAEGTPWKTSQLASLINISNSGGSF